MYKMKLALIMILGFPYFLEAHAGPDGRPLADFPPEIAQTAQHEVTGSVTDESTGETLPGVSILIKGTTRGTVSDMDGRYRISIADKDAVLVFSFLGFKSQEISVGSVSEIDVKLSPDIQTLNEVVVVGYGTVNKSDLTGSVASVPMEAIKDIPSNSVEGLLQGRSAGLQVINSSQDPGAGATVRIRGGSSLQGSNAPLVVVDGFPLGDAGNLQQINPNDIESIEVLKDASASAIYGSRGANGVIIVTTKRAKAGQTKISLQQQSTLSQFTSKVNLWRDPVLMAQLNNESRINGGFPAQYIGAVSPTGIYYPSIEELSNGEWPHNTRWDDLVFRDSPVSNSTTLTVSSANDKTSFNLSANYFTDKGVYIQDDFSKLNYNLNVSHKVYDNLKITFANILTRGDRNNNGGLAYWRSPIIPVYDENGDYYRYNNNDFDHPIAITEHRLNKTKTLDVLTFVDVEYEVIPSLTLTSRLNYKYGNSLNDQYQPKKYTQAGEFNNGAASIGNWQGNTFVSETFANFNKLINEHELQVTAGYSYQQDLVRTFNLGAKDFVNEVLQNENLDAGNPELNTVSNGLTKTELVSGIFRVNYGFRDRYLLTITSRADGSSKFGANNKWALFPSGALSWKAHEEDFVRQWDLFDELKFRASYGISGNQGISPYQTLSRFGISNYYNNGNWVTVIGPGMEVGRAGQDGIEVLWGGIPNPDLKWETTAQLNFGADLAFFDGRLRATFDYYEKYTDDLLQQRILPLSSGYDRMLVNDGSITNKGIEVTLDGTVLRTKDLTLNATAIYYRNRNHVTDLGNAQESGNITDPNTGMQFRYFGNSIEMFRGYPNLLAIGQPVNVFYGYLTDGIVQTLEDGIEAGLEGDLAQPGEFKYVDINGDGVIDEDDRTVIGNPNPDFMASLNLSLTYKRFDASVFFNGVFGNDVLNSQAFNQPNNQPFRWTPDNPTNNYPSLRDGRQVKFSDWWLEDGSFVRIQNLNLGYNLGKSGGLSARIFMNASNLFTFTKFKGYDPEVGTDGRYWGGYPRLRKWTLGLTLTL
jgi:TonB-linked SusC/RagA family outer membrane protein